MKEGQAGIYYMCADTKAAAEAAPFTEQLVRKGYEVRGLARWKLHLNPCRAWTVKKRRMQERVAARCAPLSVAVSCTAMSGVALRISCHHLPYLQSVHQLQS